ncbi:hypothetical protein ACFYV7_27940 [Nocardia suismassiliense]|uniref:Uncharacterized protein n=1 Tax=Nocardia suismassiliense TaxID=2077092 RepID=A0ABW6QZJ7_9NOCA
MPLLRPVGLLSKPGLPGRRTRRHQLPQPVEKLLFNDLGPASGGLGEGLHDTDRADDTVRLPPGVLQCRDQLGCIVGGEAEQAQRGWPGMHDRSADLTPARQPAEQRRVRMPRHIAGGNGRAHGQRGIVFGGPGPQKLAGRPQILLDIVGEVPAHATYAVEPRR